MKFINALFLFATIAAAVPAGNQNEPVPAKLEARRGPVVSCVGKKKFGDSKLSCDLFRYLGAILARFLLVTDASANHSLQTERRMLLGLLLSCWSLRSELGHVQDLYKPMRQS